MARIVDREKALTLRKKGMSYSQIKKILKISKSTLSIWLRKYPLSKQRIRELRDCNEQRIEKYRETMRLKKENRHKKTYEIQKESILPLNKRELFLSGLMLYWGEGAKSKMDSLEIANSDPSMIKFFIYWLTKILSVPKNRIRIQLHLYNDMDVDKELKYWSDIIKIPKKQFNRPYVKKASSKRINHKGSFGHGTCQTKIGNTLLAEKIIMSIKAVSERYQ